MSCISAHDPQLARLANAIAQRVGQQRFSVWFNNSTRLDLKQDGLEIAVPNDFISEWIGSHFSQPIQEAAHEVLGCSLAVRFNVVPQLFEVGTTDAAPDKHADDQALQTKGRDSGKASARPMAPVPLGRAMAPAPAVRHSHAHAAVTAETISAAAASETICKSLPVMSPRRGRDVADDHNSSPSSKPRLRHEIENFVVGQSNQLAYTAALSVAEYPGAQYNPLFIHGGCGLGKTHLLQGLCKRFISHHPAKRWTYLTGEEFTNEFLTALRANKLDVFRRKMRELDLLVIDDVHFLGGKKATQEEFLHTFNAIEAMGRQVVMASDDHPKMIEEFGESLVNRFISGMVVRIDPPNFAMRCEILRNLSHRDGLNLPEEVVCWIARRVTQNVRELEGAVTRIAAYVKLTERTADVAMAQESLGDLDRQMVAPVRPDNILQSVCDYFGLEHKDLMSGRRQRTISLARSVAMFLVRKTAKLSFPEIGMRMGKRNHSTVISACRRIERAVLRNEPLVWTSSVGEHEEEACELLQRLEEHSRALG
ncbi:MAG TPA: chromosomal replication initiator protein DnaA [Tepidisphaeraceae bacterium]|nr:chromosomal replication initiator protein DnaA [Tepidisphaeraceae bacterium]